MIDVYLQGHFQSDASTLAHPGLQKVPLLRRMTPLQKSVLAALMLGLEAIPEAFARAQERNAPIFFASAYGEVGAMMRITQELDANTLPLSPKDFQHSVLNASIAYLCMQQKSQQATFAISGGYESPDICLHMAARRIQAGLDEAALVIHAHEEGDFAKAELLLLSAEYAPFKLQHVSHSYPPPADEDFVEGDGRMPWLLASGTAKPQLSRSLRNMRGQVFRTEWTDNSFDPDISRYLPHRDRLLLVDSLLTLDRKTMAGKVRTKLRADKPYFIDGKFQAHWLVELCAQASATVSQACRSKGDGKPAPFGYLVSIRQFVVEEGLDLQAGDELLFDVVFEVEMSPIGQSRCIVHAAGKKCAEGELTFLSEE